MGYKRGQRFSLTISGSVYSTFHNRLVFQGQKKVNKSMKARNVYKNTLQVGTVTNIEGADVQRTITSVNIYQLTPATNCWDCARLLGNCER
ncbi:hypothetical protein B5X24_HaOG206201 [Helicoverpa armigera]|nr:hypothetical protein B5X24_HaOG206201 [Helicoverpa armigera]